MKVEEFLRFVPHDSTIVLRVEGEPIFRGIAVPLEMLEYEIQPHSIEGWTMRGRHTFCLEVLR